MTEWKSKRFWAEVAVAEAEGGWRVELDGRPVRTPAKNVLTLPSPALAGIVAAEWRAQEDLIRPDTMPATRMANSAMEKVAPQFDAVVDALAGFGETDLLCYRAEAPAELAGRQREAWDPMLRWAGEALGAELRTSAGILPVAQPQAALDRLREAVAGHTNFTLAALHDLVHISGSLILGLAVTHGAIRAERAWDLSRIDEEWQISKWGRDEEADYVASGKRAALLEAEAFCRAATAISA